MEDDNSLRLEDLFGDHFITPDGDAVFLTGGQTEPDVELKEADVTSIMNSIPPAAKVHVIDPTTSCESFMDTSITDTVTPIATKNSVFPVIPIPISAHTSTTSSQTENGNGGFPHSVVSILQEQAKAAVALAVKNHEEHFEKSSGIVRKRTHTQSFTASSSASCGNDNALESHPATTRTRTSGNIPMTAFEVLQQRVTHPSSVSAITAALAPELTQSRSSSVGVFNPITGLMSNVGNENAALTKKMGLPVQVTQVKNVQSQRQKDLSVPLSLPLRVLKAPKRTTCATITKTVKGRCPPQPRAKLAPKRKDPNSALPLALAIARGGGGASKVVDKRRVRNREHAKRSRLRKKYLLDSLESSLELLREENKKLRESISAEAGNGDNDEDKANDLVTKQNLSQILANMTAKNLTQSTPDLPNVNPDLSKNHAVVLSGQVPFASAKSMQLDSQKPNEDDNNSSSGVQDKNLTQTAPVSLKIIA